MARMDMGQFAGSFGGKSIGEEKIEKQVLIELESQKIDVILMYLIHIQPIVFIHGVTLRAGIFMAHRNFFLNKGYSTSEVSLIHPFNPNPLLLALCDDLFGWRSNPFLP